MRHILKCADCEIYTISEECPKCKKRAVSMKPAKFSPQDKYAKYRRIAKQEAAKEEKQ